MPHARTALLVGALWLGLSAGCGRELPLVDIDSPGMAARLWRADLALLEQLGVYPPQGKDLFADGPFIDARRCSHPALLHPTVAAGLARPDRAVAFVAETVDPVLSAPDWSAALKAALTQTAAITPRRPATVDPLRKVHARTLERQLEGLPEEIRSPVLDVALAMLDCHVAVREGLSKLSEDDIRTLNENGLLFVEGTLPPEASARVLDALARVDLQPMVFAMNRLIDICARFRQRAEIFLLTEASKRLAFSADTPIGRIVVAGTESHVHQTPAALLIDLGGDDIYRAPVGSNTWVDQPVAVLLDLSGDDVYEAPGYFSSAAGVLGLGLVVDFEGDDTWGDGKLDNRGNLGFALGGIGVLADLAGNDRYAARSASQGAACAGVGVLLDLAGDDAYEGLTLCQGVGLAGGTGLLLDLAGNDRYRCGPEPEASGDDRRQGFGQGAGLAHPRLPLAPGGVGLLIDAAGDDRLETSVGGQGFASGYAMGLMLNLGGHDTYEAVSHALGFARNNGLALAIDTSGDDRYRVGRMGLAACDGPGVAIMMDNQGHDSYRASDRARGWSISPNTFAVMVDHEGNDTHHIIADTEESLAWANLPFPQKAFRAFLDWSGRDTYIGGPTRRTADGLAVDPSRSPWRDGHVDVHTAGCLALDVSADVWQAVGIRPLSATTPKDTEAGDEDNRPAESLEAPPQNRLPPPASTR